MAWARCALVALLAEGVGRNRQCKPLRAKYRVALLAEGVGRNMKRLRDYAGRHDVALLAEGVGRNCIANTEWVRPCGRPPRGGRG